MQVAYAVNSVLSSVLIVVLIFANYIRKYNTDPFQRAIFLAILVFTFIAMIADFLFFLLVGQPGRGIHTFLYADLTVYYVFQVAAYYCILVFVDYVSFKDIVRSKRLILIVLAIQVIHLAILFGSIPRGYYFFILDDNVFGYGSKYFIRIIISYLSIPLAVIDVFLAMKDVRNLQPYFIIFFYLLAGIGAALDLLLNSGSLIWPCLSAALLYIYFFIIRTDSKVDSLTEIGNRYSFNEFMDKLSKKNVKSSHAVVMIDMDHFKEINDTLGHLEGDNALRDLASIMKSCIRQSDFLARYGGDEFILAVKAEYNVEKIMERIQKAIDAHNGKNIRPYKIQISYGCDIFKPSGGQSIDAFLTHIDSLMYKQKAERRRKTDTETAPADNAQEQDRPSP
jgi:diguanylate cyclase (GGDEF)-like protein